MSAQGLPRAEQDHRGVRDFSPNEQFGIREQALSRPTRNVLVWSCALPQPLQDVDSGWIEIVEVRRWADLGRKVWSCLVVNPTKLFVGHPHEGIAGPHPERPLVLPSRP